MTQPNERAKHLIETGKIKRLECGMLDVHIDILTTYVEEESFEKYELLDAILLYEEEYAERCKMN